LGLAEALGSKAASSVGQILNVLGVLLHRDVVGESDVGELDLLRVPVCIKKKSTIQHQSRKCDQKINRR
jgi:hypothetical protein